MILVVNGYVVGLEKEDLLLALACVVPVGFIHSLTESNYLLLVALCNLKPSPL